jgi:hypothetical protein
MIDEQLLRGGWLLNYYSLGDGTTHILTDEGLCHPVG